MVFSLMHFSWGERVTVIKVKPRKEMETSSGQEIIKKKRSDKNAM
jgi:hypothetical protein